jgi:DNA-binding NarL/FixJ family response regulator
MQLEVTFSPSDRLILRRQVRSCLPFLRRFARALTGDQHVADTAVLHVMEDLLQSVSDEIGARNLKPLLYRRLLHNLGGFHIESGAVGRTPRSRLAELLSFVEGLSRAEIAETLEVDVTTVDDLLAAAALLSSRQSRRGVVVIEDEPLISMQLEDIVRSLGHAEVRTAITMSQAVRVAQAHPPQLVLSDVQLADGSSGIEAVAEITRTQKPAVVFITAYPERLLTGLQREPTFLISKPFDADAVRATINQALLLDSPVAA